MDSPNDQNQPHAEPETPPTTPASPQGQLIRDEDFTSLYANNIRFEGSVWDLKLLFGELDQSIKSDTTEVVVIHTGMTIPWATAKLGLYYLGVQIALHEIQSGKIAINPRMLPPPPNPPDADGSQLAKEAYEDVLKLHEQFMASV